MAGLLHFRSAGLLAFAAALLALCRCKPPNIILLLTDDQDLLLGGNLPMAYTRTFMSEGGVQLDNFFVNTPVCCPSRTTLLSGKYPHNWHSTENGSYRQGWRSKYDDWSKYEDCMHMNVSNSAFEQSTIGVHMQPLGYRTGMFGKLLNPSGMELYCNSDNPQPLPGFNDFMAMCNDNTYYDNIFASSDYGIFSTGTAPWDYLTSVIGNETYKFIESSLKNGQPFFAYVAPHAPHVPATPAPWYTKEFSGLRAPRTPNYNFSALDHHYVIRSQPPLSSTVGEEVDELFENRWRTLLSVDDIMRSVVPLLAEHGEINNTYFIHTSDHGYQLGQFRLPSCKLQPYEHDIRVPFSIRGPGIAAGTSFDFVAGMVDLAPTILSLAGGKPLETMDGKSFVELLLKNGSNEFRQKHMIEYWTLGNVVRYGHYIDMPNNTYIAVRLLNSTHNFLYAEFYDGDITDFSVTPLEYELFDVAQDPYQMKNLYSHEEEYKLLVEELHDYIHTQVLCSGQQNCL